MLDIITTFIGVVNNNNISKLREKPRVMMSRKSIENRKVEKGAGLRKRGQA